MNYKQEYLGTFQEDEYDYVTAKKVYNQLDDLPRTSRKEFLNYAHYLCDRYKLRFSDLILYEKYNEKMNRLNKFKI